MRKLIFPLLLLCLSFFSYSDHEKIYKKEFYIRGEKVSIEVESVVSGSRICLISRSKQDLSANTPGENLFPKIFVRGNEYAVTWINYVKKNVKLNFYDSLEKSGRTLISDDFEFISSDTLVIFDRGKPKILVFRGIKNSDNEDVFIHDLATGETSRVARTPGNEVSMIPEMDDLEGRYMFTLTARTLDKEYRYRVNVDKFRVSPIDEKIISRGPKGRVSAFTDTEYNTIIGFGDSITWGKMRMYDLVDLYHPELTYWAKTSQYFNENYGTTYTVNLGVNKDSSYGGVVRMDTELSINRGYFFLVLFGTNDVTSGSFSSASTANNIKWILENARNNYGMFPVVSTVPPQKLYLEGIQFYKDQTEALNEKIRSLATENNFPYIDTYEAFFSHPAGWEAMLEDIKGNHPSPAGHQVMADMVIPILLGIPPRLPVIESYSTGPGFNSFALTCSGNIPFDFGYYRVIFGFAPDQMNREMHTDHNQFQVYFYPFNLHLNRTVYFKLQSVDQDGNSSDFSPVYHLDLN